MPCTVTKRAKWSHGSRFVHLTSASYLWKQNGVALWMSPGWIAPIKLSTDVSTVKSEGREAMTYISDQQFEPISLDSLLSYNIPSLKGKSRLTLHDQHVSCVSAALCLCIHNLFNYSTNRLISTKPATNIVLPEATRAWVFFFFQFSTGSPNNLSHWTTCERKATLALLNSWFRSEREQLSTHASFFLFFCFSTFCRNVKWINRVGSEILWKC